MKNKIGATRPGRSTAKRVLLAVLATVILAALAAGFTSWKFSRLLVPVVANYLKQYGVNQFNSDDIRWRWHHLSVNEVTAGGNFNSFQYQVRLQNLDIEFRWRQLIRGRLEAIAIDQLNAKLQMTAASPSSAEAAQGISVAAFLPAAWWQRLPLEQLRITDLQLLLALSQDNSGVRIAGQDILLSEVRQSAKGSTRLDRSLLLPAAWQSWLPSDLDATVELQGDRQRPLQAEIALHHDKKKLLTLSFNLTPQPSSEAEGSRQSFALEGQVDLGNLPPQWLQALQQPTPTSELGPAQSSRGVPLSIPNGLQGEVLVRLQGDVSNLLNPDIAAWLGDLNCEGGVSADVSVSGWPDLAIASARLHLDAWFRGDSSRQRVGLNKPLTVVGLWQPGARMSAAGAFATDWLRWNEQVPFTVSLDSSSDLDRNRQSTQLPAATLHLEAGPEKSQLRVNAHIADLVADSHGIAFDVSLKSGVPVIAAPPADIDLLAHIVGVSDLTHEHQQMASKNWQATGTLTSQLLALTGSFNGRRSADGQHGLNTQLNFKDLPLLLSTAKRYHPLPIDLSLAGGSGEFVFELVGTPGQENYVGLQQRGSVKLGAVSGLLSGIAFEGATFEAALTKSAQWQSTRPWQLRAKSLNAGIAITDLDLSGDLLATESLARSRWRVSRFQAAIFGGRVALQRPTVIALPLESGDLALELSDWQLSQVMDLYRDQGLQGTGVLTGTLPVRFGAEGLSISAGLLRSLPPGGVIRFQSPASSTLARNNPQLGTTLRLLENFTYSSLSAGTSFAPNGELTLDLKLSGRNPNEFDGRQVNFNINIEENLYDLLQALRVTDKVINRLEQRIKK